MRSPKNNHGFDFVESQYQKGLPFALFSVPNQNKITGVLQDDDSLNHLKSYADRGFIVAPFHSNNTPIIIKPDQVIDFHSNNTNPSFSNTANLVDDQARVAYTQLVDKALIQIKTGKMEKVVLSRSTEIEAKNSVFDVFKSLLNTYTTAFCYLVFHPQFGLWMGATPERFLTVKDSYLETVSLAGTLPFLKNENPNWSEKEIEEQHLVTKHIVSVLEKHAHSLETNGPKNQRAGNLWHLKTTVSAKIDKFNILDGLVNALHPTPAVCGLPVSAAKDFILENELHDRKLYTGYLGPINLDVKNCLELYVNLRCMQWKGNKAKIYVGAGITKDSGPEAEWIETVNKSRTMSNLL